MKFRIRMTRPKLSDWFEVEAATWEEACNDLHTYSMDKEGFQLFAYKDENPQGDGFLHIYFALMQAEGQEEVVSRVFHSGIYRKGGVRPLQPSLPLRLKDIAEKLGWTKDPMLLIASGWDGETEEWESRSTRKTYETSA